MKGILFDDLTIEISEQTPHIGSLWKRDGDNWRAYDEPALRWVHERAKLYDAPVFLDVGAHTGLFTCLAAHHAGMRVIAVEPLARGSISLLTPMGKVLLDNCRLNDIDDRVTLYAYALGDKPCVYTMKIPRVKEQIGMATVGKPHRFKDYTTRDVPTITLDGSYTVCINPPSIIKLDTEGAELSILRGGENTIRTYKPDMLIEYERKNTKQFGYEPIEIRRLLESWGATCEELPPRDLVVTWGDR